MPTTTRLATLLAALPLSALVACNWNTTSTGKNGLVEFVPSDCGKPSCDLNDGVAAGGALTITIRGTNGRSAADLGVVSSAPWVADVLALEPSFGNEVTFRVLGTGPGVADLIVTDRAGYEIDYLPIEVATISDIAIDATADGMIDLSVAGADQAWQTPIGADLYLDAAGRAFGRELTGDVQYQVTLDGALAVAMRADSDVGRGHLHLTVPVGDHSLLITAPGGASKHLLIVGR